MQNNANGTVKEKGLGINSQVRCFKLNSGQKQDGSMWGLITHVEKDANKNILQKYNLWLKNDSDFIANFPIGKTVDVRIDHIENVKPDWNTYNNKDGKKINERIINMSVVISILNVIDNNYNNNNNTYNQNNNYNNYNNQQPAQNQNTQYQQQQQPSYFDVGDNKFKNQPKQEPSPEVENYLNDNDDIFSDDDLPF